MYVNMEKRNKQVDHLTLKWCKDFQANLLGNLQRYYVLNISPSSIDFRYARISYDPGCAHAAEVLDLEADIVRPCTYDVHPSHPDALPPTVLARVGVENYKWRTMREQYFEFYYTMQNMRVLKDDILHEANKRACVRACHAFKEELVARVFHPRNLERWMEQGVDEMMFGY